MMKKKILIFIYLFSFYQIFSQETRQAFAKSTNEEITIDGLDQENSWKSTKEISNLWQWFPSDSLTASQRTEVKFLYDDKNIYIFVKAFSSSKNYIIQSLERDYEGRGSDTYFLMFDTYQDGNNAFFFESNPLGVKADALVSNGGQRWPSDIDNSWDIKWDVEATKGDGFYQSEILIPFNSLKFPEKSTKWKFQFLRNDPHNSQISVWQKVPKNMFPLNLSFLGDLNFETPLGKSKTPLILIPYLNGMVSKDYENKTTKNTLFFGGDAKISVGNGMNLDLTLNPDFSQVEVDDQIINLTRFEINLPEKRQFFILNSDLFSSFGDSRDANTFFSRRIGVAKDLEGNTIENKIIAGLRLSGKVNDNLRLGFLNMQTEKDSKNQISANNNTVFSLQQRVFSRSNIGLIFVNRQKTGDSEFENDQEEYNRILGLDYNLFSKDAKWNGKFYNHQSYGEVIKKNAYSRGLILGYNTKNNNLYLKLSRLGEGFESDLGYIRRNGIFKKFIRYQRRVWLTSNKLRTINFNQIFRHIDLPHMNSLVTDRGFSSEIQIHFLNSSRMEFQFQKTYTFLENSFNISQIDNSIPLPENSSYNYNEISLKYSSDIRKKTNFDLELSGGQFFNGTKYSIETELNYRIEPIFQASLNLNYNKIKLPKPYSSADLWLIGPKINFTFNKELFWSNYIQYSNLSKTVGINSRLQWRFAPLSDFYLVYNDNYFASNIFAPKVRSLTFKLSYWFYL